MTFFRSSFSNLGEALKTISLAIAVLGAMLSGIGYVYGTLAAQRAMASEMAIMNQRVAAIEEARSSDNVWRFRIEQTEAGVKKANEKLDRLESTMNDVRITMEALTRR